MRAVPSSLLAWAQSRPQSWYQVDFYEIGLTNGEVLRYCTYPKIISLVEPPPPGGRTALTPTFLVTAKQTFNGVFITDSTEFTIPGCSGLTILSIATTPGLSAGHTLVPNCVDTSGSSTWSQRAQLTNTPGNLGLQIWVSSDASGDITLQFGTPPGMVGPSLGIIGSMEIVAYSITGPSGTPSFDTNASWPATDDTASSFGVVSIQNLSTDSSFPLIISTTAQPTLPPIPSSETGWSPSKGIANTTVDQGSVAQICGNYRGDLGTLTLSTVTPWVSSSENSLYIDAIANDVAPPGPPPPTVWIGNDVQITASSGGKGDKGAGIPTWKCSLGGTADQIDIMVGYWSSESGQQSVIGETPWPQAVRLGLLDNATFTKYTAFWNNPADLLNSEPPIGYGDLDQYGNASDGLINLFQGYVSAASDMNRQTAKLSIRDSRMQIDVDYPRDRFSDTCVHRLFDQGCTLSASSFSATGTMGSPTAIAFTWTSGLPAGTFALGRIEYTDPVLGDISMPISQDTGTSIVLMQPFPAIPSAGQAFTAFYGCDKTTGDQGCAKFSNLAHFLGFPFVPPPRTTI